MVRLKFVEFRQKLEIEYSEEHGVLEREGKRERDGVEMLGRRVVGW